MFMYSYFVFMYFYCYVCVVFHYINRVLWQHIVLCKSTLLGMCLAMVCVVRYNEDIYLFIVFQNPYTGIRPMEIGKV